MSKPQLTFPKYLKHESEYKKYGKNDLAIFALAMYLGIDDIDDFYSNSWTEDDDDKKIDVFYIDLNVARAVIAQVYIADTFGKSCATSNKAADLNTACSWIFSADETQIPKKIQPKSIELRNAIINSEIERIDLLYVHNCYESANVEAELRTVANGARDKIIGLTGVKPLNVQLHYKEIGINTIENLFKARDKEILVDETLTLPKRDYIEEKGEGWKAVQFTVDGNWIRSLYLKHGDDLFSANYRDYLGAFKSRVWGNGVRAMGSGLSS